MRNSVVPWHWTEELIPGDAWRRPESGWDLPVVLDVLASVAPDAAREEALGELLRRIVPAEALGKTDTVQIDAQGALRHPEGQHMDTDLIVWAVECLWGRSGAYGDLRAGRTIARIRHDGAGALGYVCIPLRPENGLQTVITCSLKAVNHGEVLRLASRLTILPSLVRARQWDEDKSDVTAAASTGESPDALTPRQQEILLGMATGMTNRQIAARICFSESTVRIESMAIYRHFGVHSRSEAVAAARASGLLESALPVGAQPHPVSGPTGKAAELRDLPGVLTAALLR
jgi:DNA-binding CsgD family transcriptional regulator